MTAVAVVKNFGLNRQKKDVGTIDDRNLYDDMVQDYENRTKYLLNRLKERET